MNNTVYELRTTKTKVQAKTIKEGLKMLLNKNVRKNTIVTITEYVDDGEFLQFIPFSGLFTNKGTFACMLQEYGINK